MSINKIKKSNELLWLLGIIFVALGVSICSKADLGVSMIAAPAFVVSEAIRTYSAFFSVGTTEYLLQGVMLIALCFIVRRFNWRYLLAFAVAVVYGYTLNLFIWLLGGIQVTTALGSWIFLLIGDCITAFGVACFFRTYMPLQVYELFVAELSNRFGINISKVKLWFDISLLVISIILASTLFGDALAFDWSTIWKTSFHSIGLGTLVTTAINSPLISAMGRLIDRFFNPTPLIPRLEDILKRK